MHLKDRGFKFFIRPDKQQGRWLHPAEHKGLYSGWTDVTDWSDEKLLAYLMPGPQQHDLFAA